MHSFTQICRITGTPFVITDEDQAFYAKMGVPLPTLCPEERMRRRLSYRNERFLYHRKCDLSGKQIVSSASPDKSYPVYDIDEWWSDKWEALDYGQEFDFNRPFFDQFDELLKKVPRLALQQQRPMENSQYTNCSSRNKNCYLIFSTNFCEDCYYGSWINYSKDCIDNENCMSGTLCCETVDCHSCYNVIFAEESRNCSDSAFIKNCIGSKHCLFSTNLQNVDYAIFNKKVSKEDFERFYAELRLDSYAGLENAKKQFENLKRGMTVKYCYGTQNENITGDYSNNSRNCVTLFESGQCEDVRYSNNLEINAKDCMDFSYWGQNASQIYECHACGYDVYNLRFCSLCWSNCTDLSYCNHCFSSKNCFGCVGLKQKAYCILNKQYSKEDYEALLPRIMAHMQKTGEWGEFPPVTLSSFAYNETLAQEWFPLNKADALARGYAWQEEDLSNGYQGQVVEVPSSIAETSDEITKQILRCDTSGKLYKVIPQELAFYRKMGLPVPHRCPDQRHADRMQRRRPRRLWKRACAECATPIQSTYAPECLERVACEACYLKTTH